MKSNRITSIIGIKRKERVKTLIKGQRMAEHIIKRSGFYVTKRHKGEKRHLTVKHGLHT